ncbi:MAG TPA: sensor domain-containing diguanylate cyclase, partial [Blastocatellia bacterium]|nr:sensor domain-containing diguanylate cyclase [Blastocatellia bacterium]
AEPAAGFATSPLKLDRAAAALHSIAESNQRVTALYELARNLAGAFSLEDTTAVLANRMAKLIPFTTLAISLYDGTKSEFHIVHAVGRDSERFLFRRFPVSSGITGWVIQNRRPMYNTNPVLDLSFLGPDAEEYRTLMVFPLVKNNQALGAIGLYASEMDSYSSEYIQIMESISQPVSDSIFNALTSEQAQRAAQTDSVTGLANMRAFTAYFEREQSRNQRTGASLSVLLATAENLPGAARSSARSEDELVRMLGNILKNQLRETDFIARHGSSSFAVLLPESGSNEALEVMARVHDAIVAASRGTGLSVSLGTSTSPDDGATVEQLTRFARGRSLPVRESFADQGFISR